MELQRGYVILPESKYDELLNNNGAKVLYGYFYPTIKNALLNKLRYDEKYIVAEIELPTSDASRSSHLANYYNSKAIKIVKEFTYKEILNLCKTTNGYEYTESNLLKLVLDSKESTKEDIIGIFSISNSFINFENLSSDEYISNLIKEKPFIMDIDVLKSLENKLGNEFLLESIAKNQNITKEIFDLIIRCYNFNHQNYAQSKSNIFLSLAKNELLSLELQKEYIGKMIQMKSNLYYKPYIVELLKNKSVNDLEVLKKIFEICKESKNILYFTLYLLDKENITEENLLYFLKNESVIDVLQIKKINMFIENSLYSFIASDRCTTKILELISSYIDSPEILISIYLNQKINTKIQSTVFTKLINHTDKEKIVADKRVPSYIIATIIKTTEYVKQEESDPYNYYFPREVRKFYDITNGNMYLWALQNPNIEPTFEMIAKDVIKKIEKKYTDSKTERLIVFEILDSEKLTKELFEKIINLSNSYDVIKKAIISPFLDENSLLTIIKNTKDEYVEDLLKDVEIPLEIIAEAFAKVKIGEMSFKKVINLKKKLLEMCKLNQSENSELPAIDSQREYLRYLEQYLYGYESAVRKEAIYEIIKFGLNRTDYEMIGIMKWSNDMDLIDRVNTILKR